jgi:hypothetical protein
MSSLNDIVVTEADPVMQTLDAVQVAETVTVVPTTQDMPEQTFPQVDGIPAHLCGPVRWDHPCSAHVTVLDPVNAIVCPADGRKRKKVCIVGYAENSRHLAWYDDPDCEIWGVNQVYRFIPRMDRNFQIHRDWANTNKWAPGTDQRKWITEAPIPTYMIDHDPAMPNSVTYPYDRVRQELDLYDPADPDPRNGLDYATSSIAFMFMLAIAEGFTEIGIYGIDLIIGREYFFEKACVEFYMGIAHARGIAVHRPENSALLWQSHRYGYDPGPDYGFFGLEKLKARAEQLSKQVKTLKDTVLLAQGGITEMEWVLQHLGEPAKSEYEQRLAEARKQLDTKLNELYLHEGAFQETNRMYCLLELKSRGGTVD